jgi:hypothetical protein
MIARFVLGTELVIIIIAGGVFMFNHWHTLRPWRSSSPAQRQLMAMAATGFLEALAFLLVTLGIHPPGALLEFVFIVIFGLVDAAWIGWVYLQWLSRHQRVKQND